MVHLILPKIEQLLHNTIAFHSVNNLQVVLSFEDLAKPDYFISCESKAHAITRIRGAGDTSFLTGAACVIRDGILRPVVIGKSWFGF